MNPYSAPVQSATDAAELPRAWLTGLTLYLALVGLCGLGMALLSPIIGYATAHTSPEFEALGPVGTTLLYTALGGVCLGLPSLTSLAGAVGLHRKQSWGWWAAAISLALQMATLCTAPFAIGGLVLLMQASVRDHYEV